jgi:hypothetical protein
MMYHINAFLKNTTNELPKEGDDSEQERLGGVLWQRGRFEL